MNKFVVRQPIKDRNHSIFGYEILFQGETDSLYNQSNDFAAADTIADFLLQNSNKVFDEKIAFLTFTPNLLFRNTPKIFKQNNLVIQVEDNVIIHPLAQNLIQRYRKQGYQIAVNDFQFAPRYFAMMESIDYIKLNFSELSPVSVANICKLAKGFNKKCIAYGVNTKEAFNLATEMEVDYFQGSYIAETISSKVHHMEYLQSNFFQLVVAVTRNEPDMDEIEEIISRDAALTFAILKMVNSVYFALRQRTSSIRQAIMTLGLGQLKQWVYLLSFKQEESPQNEELLKLSFLRANFCAELSHYVKALPLTRSEAYLMGMFSTLGYLVEAPLEEALREIPVVDEIKEALLHQEGICGKLFTLILYYESADWKQIELLADELGIPKHSIAQIYFNCVEDVNGIWNDLVHGEELPGADGEEDAIYVPVEENGDAQKPPYYRDHGKSSDMPKLDLRLGKGKKKGTDKVNPDGAESHVETEAAANSVDAPKPIDAPSKDDLKKEMERLQAELAELEEEEKIAEQALNEEETEPEKAPEE